MNTTRIASFISLATLMLPACTHDVIRSSDAADVDAAAGETNALAKARELRVREGAFSLWLRPELEPRFEDGDLRFIVHGRTSIDLDDVFSSVPDDRFGDARLIGPRSFEIALDAHETHTLLFGLPLFVELTPAGAADPFFVKIEGQSKLGKFSGSRAIQVESMLRPVYVDGEVVHRGVFRLGPSAHSPRVEGPEGPLDIAAIDASTFAFTSSFRSLATWASSGASLRFTARGRFGTVRKSARLTFVIANAAISRRPPDLAWPPAECAAPVLDCLRARGADGDTSSCGDAFAVTRCLGELEYEEVARARFAEDLRAHLVSFYARHGEDVAAAGGLALRDAQDAVDVRRIFEVEDEDDDPFGHDLTRIRLLAHADVVFPGSDRVWYGAYDRDTEVLLEIRDYN